MIGLDLPRYLRYIRGFALEWGRLLGPNIYISIGVDKSTQLFCYWMQDQREFYARHGRTEDRAPSK